MISGENLLNENDTIKQAEKDMKHVNKRTQEVTKNMSDAFSK